jgi:hypothetical protein
MTERPERPEGGFEPPSGAGSGGWLPPAPPGPAPAAPPGWRVSPKATDMVPEAQSGPEPWADPGNSTADVGMGLSIAAFGVFWFAGPLALPLAIAGTVCSLVGRGKVGRGETRKGRMQVEVGLAVGIGTIVLSLVVIGVVIGRN